MMANGEFWVTLAALVLGASLTFWMRWLEKQPKRDLKPRLLPTTLVMLGGLILAVGAAMHLAAMLGINVPQQR